MELDNIYGSIFNVIPIPIFVVDDDVRVLFFNHEAKNMIQSDSEIYQKRGGEILRCIHSFESSEGCGHATECKYCVIRNAVNQAFTGGKTYRKNVSMILKKNSSKNHVLDEFDETKSFHGLITSSPFLHNEILYALLIIENISELVQLRDIIPICANCKKIRDDDNFWVSVESYIHDHTDVDFSHSICPECMDLLYPELQVIKRNRLNKE